MAVFAAVVNRDVIGRFTNRLAVVVAVGTGPEHLGVINVGDVLPDCGGMAGIALVRTADMADRLRGGVEAAHRGVTALATARCAVKLPPHVATFTGDEIMRAEQIESGGGMIKGLLRVFFRNLGNTKAACKKHDTEEQGQCPAQDDMHPSADA